ncbi:unnamed protein product [Lampetra fluviatilis]
MGNATSVTEVTIASSLQPRVLGELPPPLPREEAGAASPQRGPMEGWQEMRAEVGRLGSMVALLVASVGTATSKTEVAVDELLTRPGNTEWPPAVGVPVLETTQTEAAISREAARSTAAILQPVPEAVETATTPAARRSTVRLTGRRRRRCGLCLRLWTMMGWQHFGPFLQKEE